MKKLNIDKKIAQKNRPYYIIEDNENSDYKINKIADNNYFESINNVMADQCLTKALIIDNYFDTEYLAKIKKDSIKL